MMRRHVKALLAIVGGLGAGSAVAIDTSEPFLCAVTQVTECLDGFGCDGVLPEQVSAPTFIWVDMKSKRVTTSQNREGSRIDNVTKIDGRHILQGATTNSAQALNGAAWTLSIEDETGRFVAAVAVQQASISLFGACTELEYD